VWRALVVITLEKPFFRLSHQILPSKKRRHYQLDAVEEFGFPKFLHLNKFPSILLLMGWFPRTQLLKKLAKYRSNTQHFMGFFGCRSLKIQRGGINNFSNS
jgi:hypothetical protein